MKVILVNGSPHEHGCMRAALDEVAKELAGGVGFWGLAVWFYASQAVSWGKSGGELGQVRR